MKFGVFTVMLPDLTPDEAVQALADTGYDGVEWRVVRVPDTVRDQAPSFWGNNFCTLAPTIQEGERARSLAAQTGLAIPNLGTYINVGDLPAVEEAMAFARAAGAPSIRVGVGRTGGDESYGTLYEETVAFLGNVESLARANGIKAMVEMHHGTITASAAGARRVVEHFDPDLIGVIHDCGNMVHEGFENYRMGLELLGPYLGHVHVKNAAYSRPNEGGVWRSHWAPLQDGVVDFPALFAALRVINYDGWIVVEDFSQAFDTRTALRENIQFLRSL